MICDIFMRLFPEYMNFERHKFCCMTSIREYPPYWKFQFVYFSLEYNTTFQFHVDHI
eukprot:UN17960